METLFWGSFNLVELSNFDVYEEHYPTQWVGKTMFGSFGVISIIVLLNMLIAMMSTSYAIIIVSAGSSQRAKFKPLFCACYPAPLCGYCP